MLDRRTLGTRRTASIWSVRAVVRRSSCSRSAYRSVTIFIHLPWKFALSLLSLSFSLLTIFSGEGRGCFRAPSFVFSFAPTIMSNNSRSYPGAASASNWSCLHTQTQSRIVCVRVCVWDRKLLVRCATLEYMWWVEEGGMVKRSRGQAHQATVTLCR